MDAEPAQGGPRPSGRAVARSGVLLLSGTLLANVLSYVFFVVLSRHLSQSSIGAVGAMVNLTVIAGVPALGLQLVAAREVSRARQGMRDPLASHLSQHALRLGLELGLLATALLAVLSPLLGHLLDIDVSTLLILAPVMAPLSLTYAIQGILQGRERFGALATVLGVSGVTRVGAAILPAWLGGDLPVIVALLTAGWLLTAGTALALLPPHLRRTARRHPAALRRMVVLALVPASGLLVLSSLDVLLARLHLSPSESGAYTIGALFEKAAFWGMAFVATLFFPAMARPAERTSAITRALGVTVGVGALGVALTAAAPGPLVAIVGGPSYAALEPMLWKFTLLGCLLAVIQVLVFADLAASRVWAGLAVWMGAVGAVVGVQFAHGSVVQIVTVMLVSAISLVAVILAGEALRGVRARDGLSEQRRARTARSRR